MNKFESVDLEQGLNYVTTKNDGKKREVQPEEKLYFNGKSIGTLREVKDLSKSTSDVIGKYPHGKEWLGDVSSLQHKLTIQPNTNNGGNRKSRRARKTKKNHRKTNRRR